MRLQYTGLDETRVRLVLGEEKITLQPGECFDVNEEIGQNLLNYGGYQEAPAETEKAPRRVGQPKKEEKEEAPAKKEEKKEKVENKEKATA